MSTTLNSLRSFRRRLSQRAEHLGDTTCREPARGYTGYFEEYQRAELRASGKRFTDLAIPVSIKPVWVTGIALEDGLGLFLGVEVAVVVVTVGGNGRDVAPLVINGCVSLPLGRLWFVAAGERLTGLAITIAIEPVRIPCRLIKDRLGFFLRVEVPTVELICGLWCRLIGLVCL